MPLLDDLDRRRERAERDRENSGRLAKSYAVFKTVGQGVVQYEKRVRFGLTFVEKPVISYSTACDLNDLADLLDIENTDDVPMPHSTGYVVEWDQDERDFYVGCWVAVKITFDAADAVDPEVLPEFEHHFSFEANAIKDIPPTSEDATA